VALGVGEIAHEGAVETELGQGWDAFAFGLHTDVLGDSGVQHVLNSMVGEY
jgi:hypothetical protein